MRIIRILLIVLAVGLSACGGGGGRAVRVASGAVDEVVRAARVSDDLADDALRAASRVDDVSDDAIRGARFSQALHDDIARAAQSNGVRTTTVTDDVAHLSIMVDQQTDSVATVIRQGDGALSSDELGWLRDLLKELTCQYLQDSAPDDVRDDVAMLLERSSLVDSPIERAYIAGAAYQAAMKFREAKDPASISFVVSVGLYCNS